MTADRGDGREIVVELSGRIAAGYTAPVEYWDVGEAVLAIEVLADNLAEDHVPVGTAARARLLAVAGRWAGLRGRVERSLRWCPNPEAAAQRWTVVEGSERGRTIGSRIDADVGPGHVLHGRLLVPWLACNACADVLVRVYDPEAGAGPHVFAVLRPGSGRHQPIVHADSCDALDRLEDCFR